MGQMVIPMETERLLAVGDIHGAWDKFKSMYDKVKFNPEKDRMIFLGDYLDRGDNPVAVMDFILEHKDTMGMKFLKGNHEQMFWEGYYSLPEESKSKWVKSAREIWFDNGGRITVEKLRESGRMDELNREWIRFIEKLPLCAEMTVAGKTFWFMHADCEPMLPLVEQIPHVLLWGRSLAKYPELNQGETVIVIGHTPVQYLGYGAKPQWLNNGRVVLMDTGSSTHADGRVSCADLLSGEIYQSD